MNKTEKLKNEERHILQRIKRDNARLKELRAQVAQINEEEKERRRERSFAGKVSALRKKHPTLYVEKDPCDVGAKDVWEVDDYRMQDDADPWEGVHYCYGWQEVYDRCIELIKHFESKPVQSDASRDEVYMPATCCIHGESGRCELFAIGE